MADNFDAVDIMYNIVNSNGVACYKDAAPLEDHTGEIGEFVVINSTACEKSGFATNDAVININIHIPKAPGGLINRTRIKAVRSAIESLIDNADDPEGYYCFIDRGFRALLQDARPGYDVFVMRYNLTLNN